MERKPLILRIRIRDRTRRRHNGKRRKNFLQLGNITRGTRKRRTRKLTNQEGKGRDYSNEQLGRSSPPSIRNTLTLRRLVSV